MKKGQLKALFIEAKGTGQKYIGVMIQTEGSSEPGQFQLEEMQQTLAMLHEGCE